MHNQAHRRPACKIRFSARVSSDLGSVGYAGRRAALLQLAEYTSFWWCDLARESRETSLEGLTDCSRLYSARFCCAMTPPLFLRLTAEDAMLHGSERLAGADVGEGGAMSGLGFLPMSVSL